MRRCVSVPTLHRLVRRADVERPPEQRERDGEGGRNDELTIFPPSSSSFVRSFQSVDTSTVSQLKLSPSLPDSSLHLRPGQSRALESAFTQELLDGIKEFVLAFSSSTSPPPVPSLLPIADLSTSHLCCSNGISSNSPPQPSSPPPKRRPSKPRCLLLSLSSSG